MPYLLITTGRNKLQNSNFLQVFGQLCLETQVSVDPSILHVNEVKRGILQGLAEKPDNF
jgi:hypothetical protein